jgi:signal transduction histidine kinase
MPHRDGQAANIVTLALEADPQFVQNLYGHLDNLHYHIRAANSIEEASQLMRAYRPEAIIAAGNCGIIADYFKSLQVRYQNERYRPILILIAEEPVPDAAADITLPSSWLHLINDQLNLLIKMREESLRLEQTNQILQEENHRLKEGQKEPEKSPDDINFLKNAIVWNVAHELRTPLLQVKSAVALLAEDAGNNSVLVELAMGATTRLETVVKDITLLNELVNESMESRSFEPVLLREVIDSAIRNLRRSWQHKNEVDRIRVDIPEYLPPVYGDKQRLVIAVQLLLDNALKFSRDPVAIMLDDLEDAVRITVEDKGIGIPKDKIEHIFDTFYQVDSSITKRYGGMGNGLAIVRFIVERHRSKIIVDTEEGKGSRFVFDLPAVELR